MSQPFQIDLRGVVDLLSRHIYSRPDVYLRELLQNGVDAIRARRELGDAALHGSIDVWPAAPGRPFRLRDDGAGLSAAQAAELLSTVGRSSKRDVLELPRQEYLGQFGIGLLSCFMVADRIVVRSRSARGETPIEWVGEASGTFSVRELSAEEAEDVPVGTEIVLEPRADDAALLSTVEVERLLRDYGEYLPVTVVVHQPDGTQDTITREPAFLRGADADADGLADLAAAVVGRRPIATIPLGSPETGTRGVGFVLPYAPPPGAHQANRVYLGRMLVSDRYDGLLPDWAFFVRSVVDTDGLHPTASREAFVEDAALERARQELGACVRTWVLETATRNALVFQDFLSVHARGLKAVAVHDEELARILVPWLRFETSSGALTVGQLTADGHGIRYTETVDEFRQLAPLAGAVPIVNGGYSYDAELLRTLPELIGTDVSRVTADEVLEQLAEPPLAELPRARALERRADDILAGSGCSVFVRSFQPADLPGLCVIDAEAAKRLERERAQEVAGDGLWGRALGSVARALDDRRDGRRSARTTVRLCLNWTSPLVERLSGVTDALVFDRTVQLLYVQAMLAAHRPLSAADRRMLTGALTDLLTVSVGIDDATTAMDMMGERE